jgi:hypothetical protein
VRWLRRDVPGRLRREHQDEQMLLLVMQDYAMAELYAAKVREVYRPRLHGVTSLVHPGSVDPYINMYLWLDQG